MAALMNPTPSDYGRIRNALQAYVGDESLTNLSFQVGANYHLRAPVLDLQTDAVNFPKTGVNISEVIVCADQLHATAEWRAPNDCTSLSCFARSAFKGTSPENRLTIVFDSVWFRFNILLGNLADPLYVTLRHVNGNAKSFDLAPIAADEHRGWDVQLSEDGSYSNASSLTSAPLSKFNTASLEERILDGGHDAELNLDTMSDDVPAFLQYELLLAAVMRTQNQALTLDIAQFVMKMSQNVPAAVDFFARASALATTISIADTNQPIPFVPHLAIGAARDTLQARLQAASKFDENIRLLKLQDAGSDNLETLVDLALSSARDSERTYLFMEAVSANKFDEAEAAYASAHAKFYEVQKRLGPAQKRLNDGIEAKKTELIIKATLQGVFAVVLIAGSIAVACVAPPAGAGVVTGAAEIGNATNAVASAAETAGKFAQLIEGISKIYAALKPGLEKADKLVDAIKTLISTLDAVSRANALDNKAVEKLTMPSSVGSDVLSIGGDWDTFDYQMGEIHKSIEELKIDGVPEFFEVVKKLVIRGKIILAAQTALTGAASDRAVVLTQRIERQQQVNRIADTLRQTKQKQKALQAIKRALATQMLSLRLWISLDFEQYLDVLDWLNPGASRVIALDPIKEISSMMADAAVLQAAIGQTYVASHWQARTFYFSSVTSAASTTSHSATKKSPAPMVFVGDLKTFREKRSISLDLTATSSIFRNYTRPRLLGFNLFLDGAQSPSGIISCGVKLGRNMKDIPSFPSPSPLDSTTRALLSYVTEASVYGFEYAQDEAVVLDGSTDKSGEVLLSPLREWNISVAPDVDLTSCTGISLQVDCEVVYSPS